MDESNRKLDCLDDPWDDTLLIKAYDDSIKLAREQLARRIAISTNRSSCHMKGSSNLKSVATDIKTNDYKIGDYVRATYVDGKDYEAKILKIDANCGTCLLKYIGYENEQNVWLDNLVSSWGKKARRLQFSKAKLHDTEQMFKTAPKKLSDLKTIPPPPPMPPMLSTASNCDDSEHLSAMLMSWYMSGYYTGIYQGIQMAKASKSKNS